MSRAAQFAPHVYVSNMSSHAPITIDGLEGFETIAKGKLRDSGADLRLYQVMLFEDDGFILMQGIVGEQLAAKYESEFMALAHSLERTRR